MSFKNYLLLLLLIPFFANTQNQKKVDSLLNIYNSSESIKVKMYALDDLCDLYIYTKPDIAKKYIDEMLKISKEVNYKHGILRGEFCLGHYYSTIGQMDLGATYYRKTLERAKTDDDDSFTATCLKNLSIYESNIGNYLEAVRLMDSSATLQYSYKNFTRYGSALNAIGVIYYEMGNYSKAMEYYKQALKTMDTIEIKTYHRADLHRNIGKLHGVQTNYNLAISSYNKAMKVYEETEDNLYQSYTLSDIGNTYSQMGEYVTALEKYNNSLTIGETYDFPPVVNIAYSNIGETYMKLKKYNLAIDYIQKSLDVKNNDASDVNYISNLNNLGHSHSMLGNTQKAITYLNEATMFSDSIKVYKHLKDALYYRALAYEKSGNLKKSIADFKRAQIIKDSIFSIEKAKQIREFQTIYETEKKENQIVLQEKEIKTLNAKAANDKLTKTLYSIGMFSFLTIAGLLYFGFKQRIKKNKIAREKQEEIYKQEIAFKKKELTSQTLHLVQKSTFLQELKSNLEKIKQSPELFKIEFKRLVMLLKKESAEDKDWEVFKSYFSEVHNNFDNKIKTIAEDISEKEIRLASFLRMNLSTKEIASMLNVLPDSVLKSKYRLKKKLQLDKAADLTEFLNTL